MHLTILEAVAAAEAFKAQLAKDLVSCTFLLTRSVGQGEGAELDSTTRGELVAMSRSIERVLERFP